MQAWTCNHIPLFRPEYGVLSDFNYNYLKVSEFITKMLVQKAHRLWYILEKYSSLNGVKYKFIDFKDAAINQLF